MAVVTYRYNDLQCMCQVGLAVDRPNLELEIEKLRDETAAPVSWLTL